MPGGFNKRNPPVTICRADVNHLFDYAQKNCGLRDYVLIKLFMQTGLRTNEACTLRAENIDFESCHIHVLDSKKKQLIELPLDLETVELLRLFLGERHEGYVFRQLTSWKHVKSEKPLTVQTVWCRIHKIALDAGIHGFKPRIFRQWFCANWVMKKHGSLKVLQRYVRHDNVSTTDCYTSKLVFQEDIEIEYRLHMDPVARALQTENLPEVCRDCGSNKTCKYIDEIAPYSEVVTGCRFKQNQPNQISYIKE